MDAVSQLARGLGRMTGLLGRLVGEPKLLVALAVGVAILVWRKNSRADEIRQYQKDPATLLGLFSVRLAWWYRAPVAAVIVTWWLAVRGLGWAALIALGTLGLIRFGARPTWERLAAGERHHQWAQRWTWKWLWACFQADVIRRERWGVASPYPTAKHVEVRGENAALTVRIPPRLDLKALAEHEGLIGAQLRVKGVRVLPHPSGDMGLARVEILNRTLTSGTRLPELSAPASERFIAVGYGFDGPVHFDLDNEVGLGVFGATGAGKGILGRWVAMQALDPRHAREVWIIDPQGSGEWTPFDRLPGVRVFRYDPRRPVGSLDDIDDALDELARDIADRNDLAGYHGVDAWRYLPADVRPPRRLLLIDELSSLLARVERNDPTREPRERIGTKVGDAYRTARKAGIGFVHIDQATYQGDRTYLASGAIAQLGRWVALGGMRDETRDMVAGFHDFPYVAPVPGLGITGRRADTHPEPIEVPDVDRHQVEAVLAGWYPRLAPATGP